jgi:hypothetical protein
MADETNFGDQEIKLAVVQFTEVGFRWRNNRLDIAATKTMTQMDVGMYFIAQMLLLLFLRMSMYRRRQGRHLRSQVFTDQHGLRLLDQFPFLAI